MLGLTDQLKEPATSLSCTQLAVSDKIVNYWEFLIKKVKYGKEAKNCNIPPLISPHQRPEEAHPKTLGSRSNHPPDQLSKLCSKGKSLVT